MQKVQTGKYTSFDILILLQENAKNRIVIMDSDNLVFHVVDNFAKEFPYYHFCEIQHDDKGKDYLYALVRNIDDYVIPVFILLDDNVKQLFDTNNNYTKFKQLEEPFKTVYPILNST